TAQGGLSRLAITRLQSAGVPVAPLLRRVGLTPELIAEVFKHSADVHPGRTQCCCLWRVAVQHEAVDNPCRARDAFSHPADGLIYDTDRIMFLRSYLTQLRRATSEGVPVRGYFHWSLMDNFEWADGFGTRFGLLYVDYATQQRTPKLSA